MADVLEEKIQKLLIKRSELAGRLDSLEDLKGQTNDRVYDKIRKDYKAQLDDVLGKVSKERGALENKAASLKEEIEKHEQIHLEQSDKVDELNLRAMLKEFDENDNSFRDELNQATAERDETAESLESLRSELADLNKVLKDVDAATAHRAEMEEEEEEKEEKEDDLGEDVEELLDEDLIEEGEEGTISDIACPSCGHSNPPQKLFCENCGSALDEEGDLDEDFDLLDEDLDSI